MGKTKGAKDKQPRNRRSKTEAEKRALRAKKTQKVLKGTRGLSAFFASQAAEEVPNPAAADDAGIRTTDDQDTTTNNHEAASNKPPDDDLVVFSEDIEYNLEDNEEPREVIANLDVGEEDKDVDVFQSLKTGNA